MYNVIKHLRGFSLKQKCQILRHLNDLHYAQTKQEFRSLWANVRSKWMSTRWSKTFAIYFEKQWIKTRFRTWQIWLTPYSGLAATNNPVERYNRDIKDLYTFRKRLDILTLLFKLTSAVAHASQFPVPVASTILFNKTLAARMNKFDLHNIFQHNMMTREDTSGARVNIPHLLRVLQKVGSSHLLLYWSNMPAYIREKSMLTGNSFFTRTR